MKIFLLIISSLLVACQSFNLPLGKVNEENLSNARTAALEHNFESAISIYEKTIIPGKDTQLTIEYAKVLRHAKKPEKATEVLLLHKQKSSKSLNADFYQELGNAYLELGKTKEAEEAFFETFTLDATNWKAASNLGIINGLSNDFAESRYYFDIALNLSNNNYAVLNNYANIERLAKNDKKALKLYKLALKQKLPKNVKESINKQVKELTKKK